MRCLFLSRVPSWHNAALWTCEWSEEKYSIVMLGALYHTFWALTLYQIAGKHYSNGLLRDIKISIQAEKCDFGAFYVCLTAGVIRVKRSSKCTKLFPHSYMLAI